MVSVGFIIYPYLCSAFSRALTCGTLMIFYSKEISMFGHGPKIASKLQRSTPHSKLLIQTPDSILGFFLFTIGFLLLIGSQHVWAFQKDALS
ncbi:hypothetical protein E2542_SST16081 [Spatholobus suberectus]|nr:hypothetical protein E2542_SST16081 [Spatholobus suberectus]